MRNHMLLMSFGKNNFVDVLTSINHFLEYTIEILKHKSYIRFCYIGTARKDKLLDHLFFSGFLQFKFGSRIKITRLKLHKNSSQDQLEDYISNQDVLFIGGGNTEEMLKIWNNKGFTAALNKLRDEDKLPICAGVSAGGMYPFHSGLTDSQAGQYKLLRCLEWFQQSFCPHANSNQQAVCEYDDNKSHAKLSAYQTAIKLGHLPPGYAVPDGCMLHFYNGDLVTALSMSSMQCMYVSPDSISYIETRQLNAQNIKHHVAEILQVLKLQTEGDIKTNSSFLENTFLRFFINNLKLLF